MMYTTQTDPYQALYTREPSHQIKGWGNAVGLSKPADASSMKPVVEEARTDSKDTRFGTVFNYEVDLNKKRLGIGVMNGFIGGSGFTYGVQLAAFSVYHRYLRYRQHRFPLDRNETYYASNYRQKSCYQGCPRLSDCEWGLCECLPGYKKEWGLCKAQRSKKKKYRLLDQTIGSREGVGRRCRDAEDCSTIDINLVCLEVATGRMECQCRKDMQWNRDALECQFFLGVDCSSFSFKDTPSPNLVTAVQHLEQTLKGWFSSWTGVRTEDKVSDREKVFNMPRIQEMIRETHKLYENQTVEDHFYNNRAVRTSVTVTDHYDKGFSRGSMCPPNPGDCWRGSTACERNRELQALYNKYNKRCRVSELLADQFAVPADRTQTPEEALQFSIWSPQSTFNLSILSEAELDEAFCRDIESFSPAFTTRVRFSIRPPNCTEISPTTCAVLFDSSSCSPSGWSLEVVDGARKELKYWSSDWKYRNDADIVGVRRGCKFSAWTEVGFRGERFDLIAKESERWIVFENDASYFKFHENIESFQCNCWN